MATLSDETTTKLIELCDRRESVTGQELVDALAPDEVTPLQFALYERRMIWIHGPRYSWTVELYNVRPVLSETPDLPAWSVLAAIGSAHVSTLDPNLSILAVRVPKEDDPRLPAYVRAVLHELIAYRQTCPDSDVDGVDEAYLPLVQPWIK